ncbi:MAG: Mur ligase domain-containing protein, partial [Acutalibacteraceae bacterium]|nr:Mur ligase domain-containing protein [Acutalibacteraceae bacterium]
MKLKNLIDCNKTLGDLEITGITCDSRCVKEGYAFVCIKGALSDGHDYAAKAFEQGAAVVIAERDLGLENQIVVDNTHKEFAILSAKWFGNPSKKLKLIGVTGTNGKTSTTYMIKQVLETLGH